MSSSFSFPNLLNDTYTKNPSKARIHDVFLSFRGEDTRASFTSHLNTSLLNAGIKVFRDDDSLQRGDIISTSINRAIEQSQIAVIIFSKNYADSRWCLDELVKIIECSKSIGLIVLPVFYGVDPSEVRHQNGEFGRAFQSLLTRLSNMKGLFKVLNFKSGSPNLEQERNWTAALHEVAGFAGFVVLNSRNESEAIKDIVEKVVRVLNKTDLFVANNPVGVEPRVEDMIQLLEKKIPQHTSEPLHFQPMQAPVQLLPFQPMQAPRQLLQFQPMQAPRQPLQFQPMQAPVQPLQFQPLQAPVQLQQFQPMQAWNRLGMHDLLRDMGREIIREKSPKDPEERSRLWFSKDVLNVLSEQTGTKVVEGLTLKLQKADAKCFTTKAFKNMTRLRLLQLVGVQLHGDFEYLSRNLRWLSWNGFPLTCIPTSFYLGNLVSIELVNSNVEFLWKKAQRMEKLKILNLSHSHSLTQTPDFSNMPNLEKLVLTDCPMLSEISPSIGHLNELLLINLEDCINIRSLPRSIYKLNSLNTLILSGCLKIDKLEDDLEDMRSLTTLIANNTAIAKVPFSVVRSKSIGYISLCGYEGFSHDVFPAIIWSWMSPTNNLPSPFQTSAGLSSLVPLDVQSSKSYELSSISKYLPWLRCLLVECDSELQLSRDTKIILDALYASNSKELESTATSQVAIVETSALIQCYSQVSNVKSLFIQIGMNCQVTKILKDIILQNMGVNGCGGQLLPGDSYPDWFTFNFKGSSVIFEVPRVQGRNLKTMVCVIYSSTSYNIASDGLKNVLVKNYTKATIQLYKREALVSFEDEEGERVVSSIEPGNKVEIVAVFENDFVVKETIVYLVYVEPIGETMEKCQDQEKNDIVYGGDDNEGTVRTSSPQVELVDENGGAASCCGLIKYSFRKWITDFMCRLVECSFYKLLSICDNNKY
ncbi:disease resistance protein RPV1 [Trifolium repens]|nr:disease resistance protein RPV1 [Trifolium repens]